MAICDILSKSSKSFSQKVVRLRTTASCVTDTMAVYYGHDAVMLRLVIYSQRGNVLFPTWEYFIPNVGIFFAQVMRVPINSFGCYY